MNKKGKATVSLLLRLATASGLAVLAGCTVGVPSEKQIKGELQRRISEEANGCMELVASEKTNGYEAPSLGHAYVAVFRAEVRFEKSCKWRSPMFENRKHSNFRTTVTDAQALESGGFWGEFFNLSQNPGGEFAEGARIRLSGEMAFRKTEKGYLPLADVLAMQEIAPN